MAGAVDEEGALDEEEAGEAWVFAFNFTGVLCVAVLLLVSA